ncbi:MAG TPA: radical SAM family heme chaperone HemW [Candidatus Mailhella merdavium]|nr:radical SAM family heme chaperone HemW [Candidatus Mailhella merdavium]
MLLYIHVPFCRSRCRYCSFYSEAVGGEGLLDAASERMQLWMDNVVMEMAQWADRLGRPAIRTVYFGGGTPSLLPPSIIGTILSKAARCFKLEGAAEISMEANPESISKATASQYLREGINRVSLGAQSLNDMDLAVLGRVHCAADVTRAVYALRDAHFHNIGLDLMWGLPGQTSHQWKKQLKEVARLRPEHLSCYGLTLEEGTPMLELCRSGALLPLPDERESARMYVQGAELLEELGYLQYEISNFARMGYLCRHNMGYWEGEDYLGLGPSATSTIGGRRWTNPADLNRWARQVKRHSTGSAAETLELSDRVLELIMLRLRTTRGLRVKAYRELTGRDFLRDHKQLVHALHRHGLVRIKDGYLRLTRNGMLVSNSILERFFEASREALQGGKASAPIGADAAQLSASPDAEKDAAQ